MDLMKLWTETHNIIASRIHHKSKLSESGGNTYTRLWILRFFIYIIASQPSTLGVDFCSTSFLWCVIAIITFHLGLFSGRFFNVDPLVICDLGNVGPMAACHLVLPHLLKSFATSTSPTIYPSQTWTLTCSNFFIWARIQVSFTPKESRWRPLRSEAKFIEILPLWVLSLILSTWS